MTQLSKEAMREYMRKRRDRAKGHAEKMNIEQPTGDLLPDGRVKYPGREYREDGGVVLFGQKCEACGGTWSASIEIPCPYCKGRGERKPTTKLS